jgi:hypothetical protein
MLASKRNGLRVKSAFGVVWLSDARDAEIRAAANGDCNGAA